MCPHHESIKVANRVNHLLDDAMAISIDELERVVQEAHESTSKQMEDPDERFPVSRQALRMFCRFRCNLESVNVRSAHD